MRVCQNVTQRTDRPRYYTPTLIYRQIVAQLLMYDIKVRHYRCNIRHGEVDWGPYSVTQFRACANQRASHGGKYTKIRQRQNRCVGGFIVYSQIYSLISFFAEIISLENR